MTKRKSTQTTAAADKALGLKVRQARNEAGLSQEQLGLHLGVTFQQIQKYEKGVNRVSSTRLVQIAQCTGKSVTWFLAEPTFKPNSKGEKIAEFIASREGHTICELVSGMRPETRTELVTIVRGLARIDGSAAEAA